MSESHIHPLNLHLFQHQLLPQSLQLGGLLLFGEVDPWQPLDLFTSSLYLLAKLLDLLTCVQTLLIFSRGVLTKEFIETVNKILVYSPPEGLSLSS